MQALLLLCGSSAITKTSNTYPCCKACASFPCRSLIITPGSFFSLSLSLLFFFVCALYAWSSRKKRTSRAEKPTVSRPNPSLSSRNSLETTILIPLALVFRSLSDSPRHAFQSRQVFISFHSVKPDNLSLSLSLLDIRTFSSRVARVSLFCVMLCCVLPFPFLSLCKVSDVERECSNVCAQRTYITFTYNKKASADK